MISLVVASALAQVPPAPAPTVPPEDTKYFELSFSAGPVLGESLPGVQETGILEMASLFFEARQGDHAGIGLHAGFGRIDNVTSWELGMGGRGYPWGDFDTGLVIGGEALFVHQSARAGGIEPESGVSFGPLIGFKYVAPFGLTVDVTGGAAIMFYGTGFDTAQNGFGPIAHAQLGWSL